MVLPSDGESIRDEKSEGKVDDPDSADNPEKRSCAGQPFTAGVRKVTAHKADLKHNAGHEHEDIKRGRECNGQLATEREAGCHVRINAVRP